MKLIIKKFIIILLIICMLFPMLFSNISKADDSIQLTTERAGNYASTFAINFFQNWSNITIKTVDSSSGSSNGSGKASGNYVWPVEDGYTITSKFNEDRNTGAHKALDIIAPEGKRKIMASNNGTIVSIFKECTENYSKDGADCPCGRCGNYGNYIKLDHGDGIYSLYAHLETIEEELVMGSVVEKGQVLGIMGATGRTSGATGIHLHFEIIVNNEKVNPEDYLSGTVTAPIYINNKKIVKYGEIKTAYNDIASEINNPVQASDDEYVFSNKSFIDFVFKNALALDKIEYYPSNNYSSNTYYEKIEENLVIKAVIEENAEENNEENSNQIESVEDGIINIAEFLNSGVVHPGDILFTTQGEYLLYVGGTKVIYAQEPSGEEGALKYEYLQNYFIKVKNKLLNENKDNPDYELPAYGVVAIYRPKKELISAANIVENTENLFFNGKGYYDIDNKYSGLPLEGTYEGGTHTSLIDTIINGLIEVLEFLVSSIFYIIRAVIVGWVEIFESFIQMVVLDISGDSSKVTFIDKWQGVSTTSYSGERVTVESLFFNKVPITDANFFDYETAGGYSLIDENGNPTMLYILRQNLAKWYIIIRNLSIAILLFILIYIGIRMLISSIAEQKAKYKKLLLDWIIAIAIVMFIHFFMYFIMYLNNSFVGILEEFAKTTTQNMLDSSESSLYDAVRTKAYSFDLMQGTAGLVLYIILVYLFIRYLLIYFKRAIAIYLLGMLGSFMGVKYAFDKANGKKTTSLGNWIKDFSFNVLLQSIHALIYVLFMTMAVSIASTSLFGIIIAIAVLQFMIKADKMFMKIFGVNAKGGLLDDIDKPGNYFEYVMKARAISKLGGLVIGAGANIIKGESGVGKMIRLSKYASPNDDLKTAEKKAELAKYEKIGNRANKLYEIGNKVYSKVPIGLLKTLLNSEKQQEYRLLSNPNIGYETKKQRYGYIQKAKQINKQKYTRKINSLKNIGVGAFNTVAGAGLLVEGFEPGLHRMGQGIGQIYKENDTQNTKLYRRTLTDENYVKGFAGNVELSIDRKIEKDEKDLKKVKGKQNILREMTKYEEEINKMIEELKQQIQDAEQQQELVRQLKLTFRNTNHSVISFGKVKKALDMFTIKNSKEKIESSDFDRILDELQLVLNNSNSKTVLDTNTRNRLAASIEDLSQLDGLDAKKAAAFIEENISAPGVIEIQKLNNVTDVDVQNKLKNMSADVQVKLQALSDNLQKLYGLNQKSAIENRGTAENYNKLLKEFVKRCEEVQK